MEHVTREELDTVYDGIVKKLPNADWSDHVAYEEDSLGRMHLHTYTMIKGRAPYYKKFQKSGMSIDFTEFEWDRQMVVLNYLNKHDQSDNAVNQRFDENQYRFSNLFA